MTSEIDIDYVVRFAGFPESMPHEVLDGIVTSVVAMLDVAGVKRRNGEDPMYDHCVADLAAMYHENRGGNAGSFSPAQRAMIMALRAREPEPADGGDDE